MPANVHLPDFRWDDARHLLALLRERSLKAAAARLGVDATTVGRRVDALEAALGVVLFDRSRDGALPTAAAEELVPYAEELERAAIAFAHSRERFEAEVEGVVRISAPPGIADNVIAPALVRLRALHPRILIELDASIGYVDLTRREADLALRPLRPGDGDFTCTRLATATLVPHASAAYVEAKGRVRSLDALEFLSWGAELAHLPDSRWLARHVDPARVVLRTNAMGTQIAAAKAGLGVVLVPAAFADTTGLLPVRLGPRPRALVAELPSGDLWLVGHRALRNVPRIQAVWSFLVEEGRRFEGR